MSRIASRFPRVEPRRRVGQLISGLLSDLPRKTCWTLDERAGDATQDGMRHLLHRSKWDADTIRDDIRAEDPARCRGAGIPDGLAFATKPQLAARMVAQALDAGTPARWVAGDEVHGGNPHLRTSLEEHRTGYVLAASSTHPLVTHAERLRLGGDQVPGIRWANPSPHQLERNCFLQTTVPHGAAS